MVVYIYSLSAGNGIKFKSKTKCNNIYRPHTLPKVRGWRNQNKTWTPTSPLINVWGVQRLEGLGVGNWVMSIKDLQRSARISKELKEKHAHHY